MIMQPFLGRSSAFACTVFLLCLTSLALARAADPVPSARVLKSETEGSNRREILSPRPDTAEVPLIGFIDSPTAACYQPDITQDVCYINWYYLNVSATPNYIISMSAAINVFGKVANYQGFFQTSMYVPYNMHDRGFKVSCGALGAGGDAELGNSYAYTIRAKDSTALSAANYGTVYCPAFIP